MIYLNENWEIGDDGELKMFLKDREMLIEPPARRLVLFKIDIIEHEVVETKVDRYSFTGWLLKQEPQLLFVG